MYQYLFSELDDPVLPSQGGIKRINNVGKSKHTGDKVKLEKEKKTNVSKPEHPL